ncbi:MAG TPA: zinc-dependent peptidase [Chitinophagaceae bacterium]|nr:zinc-dependent peptidase [Chitinophagaceae bacterium]
MRTPVEKAVQKLLASAKDLVDSLAVSEEELREELNLCESFIVPHFTYFNELTTEGKERFLRRVYSFKKNKNFHYSGLDPEPQMPVLISACAVQITFGLRKYRMPFFKDIYVMADQYTYGLSRHPWIGHVNRRGIHLSWKHFMQGYTVHGDRFNVGLHEMAHALEYVNFLGTFGRDRNFTERFVQYKQRAEKLLPSLRQPCKLFTEQASHNYHECWAEGVELFFENPVELSQHYPDIYALIKSLLNQDPANKITMVENQLAD